MMFDFGLDKFLARQEKEFGNLSVRVLMVLVYGAIVCICLGVIASFAYSCYQWFTDTYEGSLVAWILFKALPFIFLVSTFISFGLGPVILREAKLYLNRAIEYEEAALAKFETAKTVLGELNDRVQEAKTLIAEVRTVNEEQKEIAKKLDKAASESATE